MISVVNGHWYKGEGEWVDRKHSPLGNPFSFMKGRTLAKFHVASREEAIQKYAEWFVEENKKDSPVKQEFLRLVKLYRETGKLVLICWCAKREISEEETPHICHGQFIRQQILREASIDHDATSSQT